MLECTFRSTRAGAEPDSSLVPQTLGHLATQQVENSLPTSDILQISWSALMESFEWAGRADQFNKIKVRIATPPSPTRVVAPC